MLFLIVWNVSSRLLRQRLKQVCLFYRFLTKEVDTLFDCAVFCYLELLPPCARNQHLHPQTNTESDWISIDRVSNCDDDEQHDCVDHEQRYQTASKTKLDLIQKFNAVVIAHSVAIT